MILASVGMQSISTGADTQRKEMTLQEVKDAYTVKLSWRDRFRKQELPDMTDEELWVLQNKK